MRAVSAADRLNDALTQQPAGPRRAAAAVRAAVPPDPGTVQAVSSQRNEPPPVPAVAQPVVASPGNESSDEAAGDGNVDEDDSQTVEVYTSRRESRHARAHLAAAGQPKLDFDKSGVSFKMILIFYLSGILVADMVL
jgi:hypothetical protein